MTASGTRAGETVQASFPLPSRLPFPAATTKVMPPSSAIERFTAASIAALVAPPKLRLATAASPGW